MTSTSTQDKTFQFQYQTAYEETSFGGDDMARGEYDARISTIQKAEDMIREKYPKFKPNLSEFTFELDEAGLVVFRLSPTLCMPKGVI